MLRSRFNETLHGDGQICRLHSRSGGCGPASASSLHHPWHRGTARRAQVTTTASGVGPTELPGAGPRVLRRNGLWGGKGCSWRGLHCCGIALSQRFQEGIGSFGVNGTAPRVQLMKHLGLSRRCAGLFAFCISAQGVQAPVLCKCRCCTFSL